MSEQAVAPDNHQAKIPPHLQVAKTVPPDEQKADELVVEQTAQAETSVRWKEKTIWRPSSSGLAVVDGQNDAFIRQEKTSQQSSPANEPDQENPHPKAPELVPSSAADWQSYAEPSSGFQVGCTRFCCKRS